MRLSSLHPDIKNFIWQQGIGSPFLGNVYAVLKPGTNGESYWSGKLSSGQGKPTIALANSELQSNQNDTVILTPESHSLSAALNISANCTNWIGAAHGKLNVRSRIGMSTAFTPMITVSGYGNYFKNIYTMHGTAEADAIGWLISGERNAFDTVHFGGPMNADQGAHASYEGVAIDGSECSFNNCIFGTDTIGRAEASPNVTLGAETLTIFEHCIFLANLTDGDPVFIKAENTKGYTWALFNDCHFMAFNENYVTPMTKAIECTGSASCALNFAPNCTFQNVTALADDTDDTFVWYPQTFSTTTDTSALISAQLSV